MSPQLDGISSTPAPVCAEVRLVMDAVRDGRATTADRLFMNAHLEGCAGCASEWVFLQATKTAWANMPMAIPSASLSARIAAATYRKPTFAQRLTGFFAFLQPVPVRVAIGVAAVAGISFLVMPRVEPPTVQPVAESVPIVSHPQPVIAQVPVDKPVPVATNLPFKKVPVASIAKSVAPKLVVPAPSRNEKPVIAEKTAAQKTAPQKLVAVVAKPLPATVKPAGKPKPVQLATNVSKPVHHERVMSIESSLPSTNPAVKEPDANLSASTAPTAGLESPKPRLNTPAVAPAVVLANSEAPDPDPSKVDRDGTMRIRLANAGAKSLGSLSGGAKFAGSTLSSNSIVSAPAAF